tara:strand:+ start:3282 stop:3788 length:507 start_codon:yes stop_codon:yes gene_type:complete
MTDLPNKTIPMGSTRWAGLRTLERIVTKITDKAIRKRGFVEAAIVHKWASIVGSEIADWSSPNRLTFLRGSKLDATLHVDVLAARALEIQHREPVLLERINVVFGYKAISKIAIRQVNALRQKKKARPVTRSLTDSERIWISNQIEDKTNSDLKKALEALGTAILEHN